VLVLCILSAWAAWVLHKACDGPHPLAH
jgi:hypothetical protein